MESIEPDDGTASLSRKVVSSLKTIGLVAHLRDDTPFGQRAGVLVEDGNLDEGGGVFVSWFTSPSWRLASQAAVNRDDLEALVFQMRVEIEYTVVQMLLSVLTAAGFEAAEADGFRDLQIHVTGVTGRTLGELVEPM